MGPLGYQEIIFIFVLALLFFGPKKLPEIGKTIGKALTEFRRASSELKSTWERELSDLERENESLKQITGNIQSELTDYGSSYTYDGGSYQPPVEDSTAEISSTVSASAPEGAEPIAATEPDPGAGPAEPYAEYEGALHETQAADLAGDPGIAPEPVGVAEADPARQSPAVAS